MKQQVMLAPVPSVHLASAIGVPELRERVAFGTSRMGVDQFPIGIPVFIYASQPQHPLYKGPVASWWGELGAIVRAVERGARSGKHPDRCVRPLTAEDGDGPFIFFWEVLNLRELQPPRPLKEFKASGSTRPFGGAVPEWPVLADLEI